MVDVRRLASHEFTDVGRQDCSVAIAFLERIHVSRQTTKNRRMSQQTDQIMPFRIHNDERTHRHRITTSNDIAQRDIGTDRWHRGGHDLSNRLES